MFLASHGQLQWYRPCFCPIVPLSTIVQNSPDNRAALSLMGYSAYYSGQFDLAFQM